MEKEGGILIRIIPNNLIKIRQAIQGKTGSGLNISLELWNFPFNVTNIHEPNLAVLKPICWDLPWTERNIYHYVRFYEET